MTYSTAEILNELLRRTQVMRTPNLRSEKFVKQNAAIDDPSRLKAYNCTRRSGKSIAVAIDFPETCIATPKVNCLYLALTLKSARNIIWDALKDYSVMADPYCKPNESRHEIIFSNKSSVRLMGADCSEKEMKKALGGKYKKVAIDEAGSFSIDMPKLVYQMIRPATADHLGQIILLGTCENIRGTFFEEVTEGREPGWSIHKWTAYDNPHMVDNWTIEVEDLIARNPNVVNASWFKTHYLNQWCADDDLLIMHVGAHNLVQALPDRKTPYEYILGIDLGYNDSTAFTVVAYHDYDKTAYIVRSFKESKLIISKVSEKIEDLRRKYPFSSLIIDGANKQAVEEMRQRYGIPLESAEKTEKAFFLKLLNDDLIVGNVKIVESGCAGLLDEWEKLQWEDLTKQDEDPRCSNHESDSALYAWRKCYHYLATREPENYSKNSAQYMQREEEREAEEYGRKKGWLR